MAGSGTPTRATAVATAVSTEGVVLTMPATGGDVANPSTASNAGTPNTTNNLIEGVMNITAGTGTTAVVLRCRRGSIAGTQVGTSQTITLAAGASTNIPFEFQDPNAPIETGYVLTIQQTGGTGAGTVNEVVAQPSTYI